VLFERFILAIHYNCLDRVAAKLRIPGFYMVAMQPGLSLGQNYFLGMM
jgi:hypothetical protein